MVGFSSEFAMYAFLKKNTDPKNEIKLFLFC